METGIKLFFAKFSMYIIAAMMAIAVIGYGGWYVSNVRLQNEMKGREYAEMQLKTSNDSYNSIKEQFVQLTDQLKANQEKALENQAVLQDRLKNIVESDKSRVALEQALLARAPVTDCKTPKEVLDAWKRL